MQAKPYLAKGAAVINVAQCATVYFGKTVTEWVSVDLKLLSVHIKFYMHQYHTTVDLYLIYNINYYTVIIKHWFTCCYWCNTDIESNITMSSNYPQSHRKHIILRLCIWIINLWVDCKSSCLMLMFLEHDWATIASWQGMFCQLLCECGHLPCKQTVNIEKGCVLWNLYIFHKAVIQCDLKVYSHVNV